MKITELKMETFLKMCNSGEIAHNSDNENWVNELIQIGYDFCKKEYEEKLRWIPIEEKEPPLNEQVILKYDTDEYCIGVLTVYGFYLQPFDPIENDFGSIFLAGTVNAWRSFL